jgi:alpha,alpha-trehalase
MDGMKCREDVKTACGMGKSAAHLHRDIASAAESGWDFSSRWMSDPRGGLAMLRTTRIIPADLNAFLYKMETDLARFAQARLSPFSTFLPS